MAPIDNGEEKIERVSSEVGRTAGQAVARVTVQLGQNVTRAVAARSMRAAATSLRWTLAAVQKPGGKVSMKELSELPSRMGREVVSLADKDVMQALEKNLKGRGVHYAIEREKIDGKVQHILHVRGDDAQVVADSLDRAAEAVDAKRERKQDRKLDQEAPKETQKQDQADASPKADDSQKIGETKAPEQGKAQQQKTSETVKPKKSEPAPTAKRSKAETAQMQKEIREKVKTRADEIKAAAPKQSPKMDVPSRGMKR